MYVCMHVCMYVCMCVQNDVKWCHHNFRGAIDIEISMARAKLFVVTCGVAIRGPTRALALASTYMALVSKTDKNYGIIY